MEVHDEYVRAPRGRHRPSLSRRLAHAILGSPCRDLGSLLRPRRAARFGIGGDSTQHLLWRLDHGEIDGIHPKVVVLLIGTNNLVSHTPAEIAEGITAVVAKLREKLPASRILLLGLFPARRLRTIPRAFAFKR